MNYQCKECNEISSKWSGQCQKCQAWNTLEEYTQSSFSPKQKKKSRGKIQTEIISFHEHDDTKEISTKKISTQIEELDRVLSNGITPGGVTLISGEPGIGKSTLVLQIAQRIAEKISTLYISGEESFSQVQARLKRIASQIPENLFFSHEIALEKILAMLEEKQPELVIIDSVQTLYTEDIQGISGGLSQIRFCSEMLTHYAKKNNCSMILVGHITKDGQVAGPKTLEHIVDTVLYFEGERSENLRMLKCLKNRFGNVDETGIFHMTEKGLVSLKNPSDFLLQERKKDSFGSTLSCAIEGNRAFLLEIQALVTKTSFGYPKRTSNGFPQNRLDILIAICQKYLGLKLESFDVYINVVGGFLINDRALDLAIIGSLISSYYKKNLPENLVIFGEVGLTGEIRSAKQSRKRISETLTLIKSQIITAKSISKEVTGINCIKDFEKVLIERD